MQISKSLNCLWSPDCLGVLKISTILAILAIGNLALRTLDSLGSLESFGDLESFETLGNLESLNDPGTLGNLKIPDSFASLECLDTLALRIQSLQSFLELSIDLTVSEISYLEF